jgi:DNA polymerase III delta prime subunit
MADNNTVVAELIRTFGITIALFIVFCAAIIAGAGFVLRAYLERLARQSLDKELETHKQQLQLRAAAISVDYQRQLKDFGIYTQQRHRSYAGIYKRLLMTEGGIKSLWGFGFGRTYEDSTREEIADLLKERNIPGKTAQDILSKWDTDQKRARELLSNALHSWKIADAHRKLQVARNYQLLNELYFSEAAASAIENAYQMLGKYLIHAQHEETSVRLPEAQARAGGALVDLHRLLRAELARGDYALPDQGAGLS